MVIPEFSFGKEGFQTKMEEMDHGLHFFGVLLGFH